MMVIVYFMGCASPSVKPDNGFVVNQSLDSTRSIAKDVMTHFGLNVNELSSTYLEGLRAYQMNFLGSTGGEKVEVWLEPLGENQTRVSIKTIKQMLGMVGQHRWENDIKQEILNRTGQ